MPKKTTTPANKTQPTPAPAAPTQDYKPNHAQMLIADQVGDMLVHGCHPDELEMLLVVALRHRARGYYSDEVFDMEYKHNGNELRREIERAWPAAPPKDEPLPQTVTDRVRGRFRARLNDLLETFRQQAVAEEVNMLIEVMDHWYACQGPHAWDTNNLASAFDTVLGHQNEYIKVPAELEDVVRQQIALIQNARRVAA